MGKMKKSELIRKIADLNPKVNFATAEMAVDTILKEITHHLSQGGRVELRGFGVFEVRKRREKMGRNPKTGEKVSVPEKSVPFFKAGKLLNQNVNS